MSETVERDPAKAFAIWLGQGPKLAREAGLYVGIKVTPLRKRSTPSQIVPVKHGHAPTEPEGSSGDKIPSTSHQPTPTHTGEAS